jgi:glycosyltransferase involved in cell wall biosynthesis
MQSFLGEYQGCATNREEKLKRAIDSVIGQTFEDWEMIIVSDGCEITYDIIEKNYWENKKISCYFIPKQPMWSGTARDIGKFQAKGDFIIYLDSDDQYGPNHLQNISDQLNGFDWVYYNDFIYHHTKWAERLCVIQRIGYNGTSNVCYKRSLEVSWSTYTGYAHDHIFNRQLVTKYKNFAKIKTPAGYYVCHLPPHNGGQGYDI